MKFFFFFANNIQKAAALTVHEDRVQLNSIPGVKKRRERLQHTVIKMEFQPLVKPG